jgi:prepilin-type N-terminal cleavage/methylation domain-containing protein
MSMRRERGFSLIELIVVSAIIAILAFVAVPNLIGYFRLARVRAAVRQLAGSVQTARSRAVSKNVNNGVMIVAESPQRYWVHMEDDATPPVIPAIPQPLDLATPVAAQSTAFDLPGQIRFAASAAECQQLPPGVPAYTPTFSSVRFNRLGAACATDGTAGCPSPTVSGGVPANVITRAPVTREAVFCLYDPRTGLSRWVTISVGGRVNSQQ